MSFTSNEDVPLIQFVDDDILEIKNPKMSPRSKTFVPFGGAKSTAEETLDIIYEIDDMTHALEVFWERHLNH